MLMTKSSLLTACIIQGCCWLLAATGYFYTNGWYTDFLGLLFSFSFLIGHMLSFAWILFLLNLPFTWFRPRVACIVFITTASLFSFFLAADLLVFSQYRFHIGLSLLEMFFGSAGDEIFIFSVGMWMMLAGAACVLVLAEIGIYLLSQRWTLSKKTAFFILGLWASCFLLYNGLYAWGKFKMVPSIISQQRVLPLAHPLSANRRLEKWGFSPAQDPYFIPQKGALQYPASPLHCTPPKRPKNILIFMIDSWRADTVTPQIMPQLSRWLSKPGMHLFTQHLAGGNSTAGGVFSFFYSIPHSYWDDITSRQIAPPFLQYALELGYTPGIFASSQLTSPEFNRNVFSSIDNLRLGSDGNSSWERDQDAVQDFEHFLQKQDKTRPFLGFIFLDAPHGYSYPESARRFTPAKQINYLLLNNNTDPTPYLHQYQNAVYFTDGLIDRVLRALQQQDQLENTFIIITGDHGQELNDSRQNYWGHNSNFSNYQTQVPLVVYDASRPASSTLTHQTSHHDVAPTLLQELYNCTNPTLDYALGKNLFDSTPRPFIVFAGHTEKAIRLGNDILVFNEYGGIEQYDQHLKPLTSALPAARVKDGLKAFSRFYK